MNMSISEETLLCELCLTNRVPYVPVKITGFECVFYNFLQQIFENFKINVSVNEIQNRMCPECAGKIIAMCEDLKLWRAAQRKRIAGPMQDHETVIVKMEPPETEEELEQDSIFYEHIELTDVKVEKNNTDDENLLITVNENLLIIPDSSAVDSLINKTHGIHHLKSNVIHKVRRYNCNHPGCTASFTYKRSYETHTQKCHLNLKTCRKLKKACQTHIRTRSRKSFYRGVGSIQDYHYNDCGQGHFIKMQDKPMQKCLDVPKQKSRPKREIKLCHYNGKGHGRFISLNTTKTL